MDTATLACLTRTCSMDTAAIDTRLKNLTTEVAITSRSTAEIQYVNQRGEFKHVHMYTPTHIMKFIVKKMPRVGDVKLLEWALLNGHLDMVKALRWGRVEWPQCIGYHLGIAGNLDMLKYVNENQGFITGAAGPAGARGDLAMVKYICESGALTPDVWSAAARGGHIDVLRYLNKHRMEKSGDACAAAAWAGRLDVLKWLRAHDFSWWGTTSEYAAGKGFLDVVEYAHENGCPWGDTSHCAAFGGHLDVLKYAHENGCPHIRHQINYNAEITAYINTFQ